MGAHTNSLFILPLCIPNPQLLVGEVKKSFTFNNLTSSARQKKRGGTISHFRDSPSATSACVCVRLFIPECATQARRCFEAQIRNATQNLVSPVAQTGPCVLLLGTITEERHHQEEWRRTRRGKKKGLRRRGMSKKKKKTTTSETSGEIINNHKKFSRTYWSNRPSRSSCMACY